MESDINFGNVLLVFKEKWWVREVVMSDLYSYWVFFWLFFVWFVLWVRVGGRFCVLYFSRFVGVIFRVYRFVGWVVVVGVCWFENYLFRR